MTNTLTDIKENVERAVEAFFAVFPLNIEVVDAQRRCIAVCSGADHEAFRPCAECYGSNLHHTLSRKKILRLEGMDTEAECGLCASVAGCKKRATLYQPILMENKIIGAMLVSANDAAQAELIKTKTEPMIALLACLQDQLMLHLSQLTQRRQLTDLELLMKEALNHLYDGALVWDENQNVVFINARGQNLLGINTRQWDYLKRIKQVNLTLQKHNDDGTEEYLFTVHGVTQHLRCHITSVGVQGRESYRLALFSLIASQLESNPSFRKEDDFRPLDLLIGRSSSFLATVKQCHRTAYSGGCALLQGESGTGKEALARSIHWEGAYRENRFVRIGNNAEFRDFVSHVGLNAADKSAIPDTYLETMRSCTLYMDEISMLDHYHQDKLLMIIQDSFVCNFKVLCATSSNLRQLIAKGEFHENLFYALGRDVISVPALRERAEDIRLFAAYYIARYNSINNKNLTLSEELLNMLEGYPWPGNLNELESFIAHTVECCPEADGEMTMGDLPGAMRERLLGQPAQPYRLADMEKQLILKCLNNAGTGAQSKVEAARALGISLATLYRKMSQYGIHGKTQFADK